MNETGAEVQTVAEPAAVKPQGALRRAGQRAKGVVEKAGGWINEFNDNFISLEKRVPLESINPQTVAWTIHTFIRNPARERFGMDPLSNGFDLPLLMSDLGYMARTGNEDYMVVHPEAYRASRQALQVLVNEGVLEMTHLEAANRFNETTEYRVVDPKHLAELAKQGGVILKR